MNVSIERATPADAEALVEIGIESFHYDSVLYPQVELGGPPGYDSVEAALSKIADAIYYKILLDGQLVGGIVVYDHAETLHLDLIFIAPEFQNRGIGTQALELAETVLPARTWTLDTPAYAVRNQHFYEKFGYRKVGEAEHDGLLLYAYEKTI